MNNHNNSRRSVVWPLIIISIGVALLADNLGILNKGFWETVINLWPVLLIALGLESLIRYKSLAGPFFLFSIGSIFLLVNFNIVSNGVWIDLLRFWPIYLIALGLEVLVGRRSLLLTIVGVFLSLVILAGGLWFYNIRPSTSVNGETSQMISHPLGDFDRADIVIEPGVAELNIKGVNDSNNFVDGTIQKFKNEAIIDDLKISGKRASYVLRTNLNKFTLFPGNTLGRTWDLIFHSDVILDLTLQLGVSNSDLNLKQLNLGTLNIDVGVGKTDISFPSGNYSANIKGGLGIISVRMPDEGNIRLKIDGGIGSIQIDVPEGANVQIEVERGISGFRVPGNYSKQGDHSYFSPNYIENGNQIRITINQGIGSISIHEN